MQRFSFKEKYSFAVCWQVELCGHATLAAAHTLFASGKIDSDVIEFVTLSGILTAKIVPENNNKASDGSNIQNGEVQKGFLIELNFPADPNTEFNSAEETLISKALGGASVVKIRKTTNLNNLIVIPLITQKISFRILYLHTVFFFFFF